MLQASSVPHTFLEFKLAGNWECLSNIIRAVCMPLRLVADALVQTLEAKYEC